MAPSPLKKPQKSVDEMSPDERAQWQAWLFAEGLKPVAIRQDIPPSVSSYSRDAALGATVEHVNGETYVVELIDGELTRVGGKRDMLTTSAPTTAARPEVRLREVPEISPAPTLKNTQ